MATKNDEYISLEETARLIHCSVATVREGIMNGTFPIGFVFKAKREPVIRIPRRPMEDLARTGVLQSQFVRDAAKSLSKTEHIPMQTAMSLMYHAVQLCHIYAGISTISA